MTISRRYTLITPRADRTGPTNVAVDIGRAAAAAGWDTRLLYLSGEPSREDLGSFAEVRRWRLRDIWELDGVIHTHCLRPDLVGWLFTWNPRCTVMTTLHNYFSIDLGFDHDRCAVRLAWFLWSRALRRFAHRVCISVTMCRYYHRQLPSLRFDLAYNFRARFAAPSVELSLHLRAWFESQRARRQLVLVYVGSLSPRKNVASLLDALAEIPEISLVLCGAGPEAAQLRASAMRSNLFERVLFAGQVADPDEIIRHSDLLVLPSLAEGLPLAVLEAARAGRPSLMSNIAVHRELAGLGFGATFDRHRFTDFRATAHALAGEPSCPPDPRLFKLWEEHYSAAPGFEQYAKLVGAS